MTTGSASEPNSRLGEPLERGEEAVVTHHEKPVARMISEGRPNLDQVQQAVATLNRIRNGIMTRAQGQPNLSDDEVRSAIDEGRD